MPGRNNLGLGRHWHFWAVNGWLLAGLIYVVLLFATPQWRRLVPTSWEIFPAAWQAIVAYAHFRLPPEGNPFNAIQQLTYFFIIFILSPLQIVTGIMMSPALAARFPWFPRILGGRQAARSLHFIGLIVFVAFIAAHVTLVLAHGFTREMTKIVLGNEASSHAGRYCHWTACHRCGLRLSFLGYDVIPWPLQPRQSGCWKSASILCDGFSFILGIHGKTI